jgi:O-antigen/teichoic acid export membrane protein
MQVPSKSPESVAAPSEEAPAAATEPATNKPGLVRNTVYLTAAQAITIPLSVVTNALIGRYWGPGEFGHLYLATTLCTFAVLGLEWGQQGALPALVARDRGRAAAYVGTSVAWRSLASLVVAGIVAATCHALHYPRAVLWAVGLSFPLAVLNSFGVAFKDTIRGFERTDIPALAHVAQQVLLLVAMLPVLLLGGRLRALLTAQIVVTALIAWYLKRSLRVVGIERLRTDRSVIRPLLELGTPFVFFGLAMVLQPNVNATFLAKLVPEQVVGWYGVSQRLIGLLIFPASALVGALYPTLCRLHVEDKAEFVSVTRNSLYGVSLLAIPAAVGSGVFPEIGVSIFGRDEFWGATEHLRVMSAFVFLVYFSMPLGVAILASNRQKIWTLVQCICVGVSLVGNPFLIPYFQRTTGNGAIGTCWTSVVSEVLVVGCGIALSPRSVVDRTFLKSFVLALLAGGAMAAVGLLLKPVSLFLAVPAAGLAYVIVAWFSGAVQPATIEAIKATLARKLARVR